MLFSLRARLFVFPALLSFPIFPVLLAFQTLAALPAMASTTTTTTLAITQGGKEVTSDTTSAPITLTATVLAGSAPVTAGTVNFCDAAAKYCTDIHILGTAQLTSAGRATMRFVPGNGDHSYKAIFIGTNQDAGSTSSVSSLSVSKLVPTSTTIAQSGTAGDNTLTAMVSGVGGAAPTGTVSFLDTSSGNEVLGSADLGAGVAGLNFVSAANAGIGVISSSIATGDFNGDGLPDLSVLDQNANSVTALLGKGDGTFTAAASLPVGGSPHFMVAGDFNGDGILDLALADYSSSSVTILLGRGDGTFAAVAASPATGMSPQYMAVGDFNRDGILDLAVVNVVSKDVTILLGKGDGTFTRASVSPATGSGAAAIAVSDFNGDGKADLAVPNTTDNTVTILLGNGDGTFTAAPSPATGSYPFDLVLADFNGDGKADLATSNGDGTVTVLLGNGDGTFTPAASPSSGASAANSIVVGDFNGDGKADLAMTLFPGFHVMGDTVTMLLGNGDGTFTAAAATPPTPDDPASIVVADFNGDGRSDMAVGADGAGEVLLTVSQTATAAATGITLSGGSGAALVVASYPGDKSYDASASSAISVAQKTASLTPNTFMFPGTYVGDVATYQKVTLTNTSGSLLNISAIEVTNTTNFYSFGIREQTCGSTLAAGASCTFYVAFRPTNQNEGVMGAQIRVVDDAYNSPQIVQIYANVQEVYTVQTSTGSLTFPDTYVGDTAAYQKVTVSNPSDATLNNATITVANTTNFYSWGIREQTCGSSLPAHSVCTFYVAFRPTKTGPITADIFIVANPFGGIVQKITLSGTGK